MCDSLVAAGAATADGSVILAKNSDRQPKGAQVLLHVPQARHGPGSSGRCTHIALFESMGHAQPAGGLPGRRPALSQPGESRIYHLQRTGPEKIRYALGREWSDNDV